MNNSVRKFKLRHIILLSVAVLASTNLIAQCSINRDDKDGESLLLSTLNEKVYRNEDLENGLRMVYIQSVLTVNKSDKNMVKFDIIVSYAKTGYQPELVPREVTFTFNNGQTLFAKADEYDSPVLNGVKWDRCYFRIAISDMEKIKNYPISSLTVIDSRTGKSIVASPYAGILQEQIQCLLRSK